MFSPKKRRENPNPLQSLGKKRKKPRPLTTPPRRVKTKPKSQQPHPMKFGQYGGQKHKNSLRR
jgi:hypothetical protein